ncbi:MAG: CDP-alcohol phosphatidyltransferase family protein, partial [Candidatus Aenigmatarchaeota archaeon]
KSIEGGLLERPERIIILSVGIMLGEINRIFVVCVLILIALFTNITALQRIKKALK